MKTIVFFMPQLGGGGAERVVSTVLKFLDKKKYKIFLVLIHNQGDYLQYLPDEVTKVVLNSKKARYALFDLVRKLREINPDIVFTSLRGNSLMVSLVKPLLSKKTKIIFREDNTPSVAIKESRFSLLWKLYYLTFFKRADYIICQSDFMKNDFKKNFNISGDKIGRIYNPIDFEFLENMTKDIENPYKLNRKKNIVIVTRMAYQKGIDILLQSIYQNKSKLINKKIFIIGEGKLFQDYKRLAEKLDILDIVTFTGRINNPFVWMKYADLFVLPSRYEGLPNVLLEAAALNCEIITTNHPGGTKEIMQIIGREKNMVNELDWDESWFEKKVSNIDMESLYETFNVKSIIAKYESIFDKVSER